MEPTRPSVGVIHLAPSRRRRGMIDVRSDSRVIGILSAASVAALSLRDGAPGTPEIEAAVQSRVAVERAHKAAADLLARRRRTSGEIRDRLLRRGFDLPNVDAALRILAQDGAIDDLALARDVARRTLDAGAGPALLESKLATRGVDPRTATRAITEQLAADPAGADAFAAAARRAASLDPELPVETRARRLAAYLARRGFDESAVADAVRRVLHTWGDADEP